MYPLFPDMVRENTLRYCWCELSAISMYRFATVTLSRKTQWWQAGTGCYLLTLLASNQLTSQRLLLFLLLAAYCIWWINLLYIASNMIYLMNPYTLTEGSHTDRRCLSGHFPCDLDSVPLMLFLTCSKSEPLWTINGGFLNAAALAIT